MYIYMASKITILWSSKPEVWEVAQLNYFKSIIFLILMLSKNVWNHQYFTKTVWSRDLILDRLHIYRRCFSTDGSSWLRFPNPLVRRGPCLVVLDLTLSSSFWLRILSLREILDQSGSFFQRVHSFLQFTSTRSCRLPNCITLYLIPEPFWAILRGCRWPPPL